MFKFIAILICFTYIPLHCTILCHEFAFSLVRMFYSKFQFYTIFSTGDDDADGGDDSQW